MPLTRRENFLRNASFKGHEWIPVQFYISQAKRYPGFKRHLEQLREPRPGAARHEDKTRAFHAGSVRVNKIGIDLRTLFSFSFLFIHIDKFVLGKEMIGMLLSFRYPGR